MLHPVAIPNNDRPQTMALCHDHLAVGHFRNHKIYKRLKEHYHWKGTKRECHKFVQCCTTCCQTKHRYRVSLGQPHPLLVPMAPWYNVTMDLVMGLPQVGRYDMVCTVVDQFSKEIMVFPTTNSVSAQQLTALFKDHVWNRHGTPHSIISDCSLQFIAQFTRELSIILGITTRLSLV